MDEAAQREMTLAEWMGRLAPFHFARREYESLLARATTRNPITFLIGLAFGLVLGIASRFL